MRVAHLLTGTAIALGLATSTTFAADNELTEKEKQEGWQLLFNGKDHTGWKCNNGQKVAAPIEQGALVPYRSGGDLIVYEKQFSDFILKCDVKMPERCNSGIFFRVEELNNPVNTGFEIQIITGNGTSSHSFGAIYDLAKLTKNASKGPGVWNSVEIMCNGPRISVTVNGKKVCAINCDEFDKPGLRPDGRRHKYKLNGQPRAIKDFARSGYIGFQDHGAKVWYKNVKILELKG